MEQMTNLPAAVLARGLAENPDKIAFALLGPARAERWSYARLHAAVTAVTGHLQTLGLPDGPVAVTLPQSSEAVVAVLALIAAGHMPVICGETAGHHGCATVLGGDEVPAARLRAWGEDTAAPAPRPATAATALAFALPDGRLQQHDIATLLTEATAFAAKAEITAADRVMWAGHVTAPRTFSLGLLATLQAGGTLLLPAEGLPVETLALLMKRHDATVFAAAPRNLSRVLAQNIGALPRMRHGLSFGEALPPATAALWAAKTATPLRDLGPAADTADLAAFALVAENPAVTEAGILRGAAGLRLLYAAGDATEQPLCAIGTGAPDGVALCPHQGLLPRDGDGCLVEPTPLSEQGT